MFKKALFRNLPIIFGAAIFLLALFSSLGGCAWVSGQLWNIFGRYRVEGSVSDISSSHPVELAEIQLDERLTYTNYQGFFHYENLNSDPQVTVVLPSDLEIAENGFDCLPSQPVGIFDRLMVCQIETTPTLEAATERIADSRLQGRKEALNFIRQRHQTEWELMHPDSRQLWDNDFDDYQLYLRFRDQIIDRLGRKYVSYSVLGTPAEISGWEYPLTGRVYPDGVWEVKLIWNKEDGTTETTLEHFKREERWWRHFTGYKPADVKLFVGRYTWLLELIEEGKR